MIVKQQQEFGADALGHYFQPNGTQVGFTGAYAIIDACPACPTKPIAGECKANAGVSLTTTSTCFYICSDTSSTTDISNSGSMDITNVAGWTKPCDLSSSYHYYFLVVNTAGSIVKVIDGDTDSDGIPNFAESPTVNTNVDLSGITPPGDYKVVGFYTNGSAPTVGTSSATAASTGCSSVTGGSIGFTVLNAVRIKLSVSCTRSTGCKCPRRSILCK
jgi:hypothetical protein